MSPRHRPTNPEQQLLPLGPVHNSELFSNYWLQKRLPFEPEWNSARDDAARALEAIASLWSIQEQRVERYGNEAGLEEAFIQPVFAALGWRIKYQTFLQHREPDYALFLEDRDLDLALAAGRTSADFWSYPVALADAKAWHVSLDRPTHGVRREYPPEQIEWYLDRSRLDWGILTNGRLWRLISRELLPGKPRFRTFFQVNLPELLAGFGTDRQQAFLNDEFLSFFLFFSPHGFRMRAGEPNLLARAISGTSLYSVGVSEQLKDSVFVSLKLCIQGFLDSPQNGLDPARDLSQCRQESLIFLYRLLFVLYAEDRGLLPYRRNSIYTNNRSLARLRDEIATLMGRRGAPAFPRQQAAIWEQIQGLFDLISEGHLRYGVPEYNGGLFDPDKHPFLATKQISDFYLAQVIDKLSRSIDPLYPDSGLVRVDYRDLAIQQLGAVYEGLLEVQPNYATRRMVVVRHRVKERERIIPIEESLPVGFERTSTIYEPGSIYLTHSKDERRTTGSYYTPDHVVLKIVKRTLSPLCLQIHERLKSEIADVQNQLNDHPSEETRLTLQSELSRLQIDYANRILSLRVLDPAMGSGHFLIRACQFLAEEIATNPYSPDIPARDVDINDETTLLHWKRQVVEHSIFGADFNPMAVELAKLALWLDTASVEKPLTFLDHHLRVGNSLVGGRICRLGGLPGKPPLLNNDYASQVRSALDRLLRPLAQIDILPSDSERDIREKDKIYRRSFLPVQESFSTVADIWCSTFFGESHLTISDDDYNALVENLGSATTFQRLIQTDQVVHAVSVITPYRPFHWEIEFPRVFFPQDADCAPGFDAVIGNPPYDVLADLELGLDLSGLQAFIGHDPVLAPSRRGKNNLYKLFVCRAFELVRTGGYLGFIVPMPILGDEQAVGVRQALLNNGRFTKIDTFPQKDDPSRRIFRDAKLSTAVFSYQKGLDSNYKHSLFRIRTHPENTFSSNSPTLHLTGEDICLYDPSNATIPSCSQEDWVLATRLIRSGRCTRLGVMCQSHQGEVNETTDGQRGCVSNNPADGVEILRGAHITLYAVRDASQGEKRYLRETTYRRLRRGSARVRHVDSPRVGFQRSAPQNNFRRLIAAPLPPGSFCFDTVSYVSAEESRFSGRLILGLLNSKLLEWYFRLGSTNSKVNEYQFANLPCPHFSEERQNSSPVYNSAVRFIADRDLEGVLRVLRPVLSSAPYPRFVIDLIEICVDEIVQIEGSREISRAERSCLSSDAQILQDVIDIILFEMAGFTDAERRGVEERLEAML